MQYFSNWLDLLHNEYISDTVKTFNLQYVPEISKVLHEYFAEGLITPFVLKFCSTKIA